MIAKADIRRVQEMGHADIQTTMRYLHYAPRDEDAELVAEAFRVDAPVVSESPKALLISKTSRKTSANVPGDVQECR